MLAAAASLIVVPGAARADAPWSLREQADRAGLLLGTAFGLTPLRDGEYSWVVRRQSNAITFENETKMAMVQPRRGVYDFSAADTVARFAAANGLKVRGHALLWHEQNPDWLMAIDDRDELLAVMEDHIKTVVGHFHSRFPGLVVHWDVVNEAIERDGTRRRSIWQRVIGDDYVEHAFRFAREADPGAHLFYNDFIDRQASSCDALPKCRGMRALVTDLHARGVPIDGVGVQGHIHDGEIPDFPLLLSWVGALGLEWAVTEFDAQVIPVATLIGSDLQPRAYRIVARGCLVDPACHTFVTWGVSDRHSWYNDPPTGLVPVDALHFDRSLSPKPSGRALYDVLAGAPAAAPRCFDSTGPLLRLDTRRSRVSASSVDLRGHARDQGCSGTSGVEVALVRTGKAPRFRRARGSDRWRLARRTRLGPGRYRVVARARDARGNRTQRTLARVSVTR